MASRPGLFVLPPPEELRERLYRRMRRQGATMAGQDLWTEDELAVLRALAPDYDLIKLHLKNRSRRAIRHKCAVIGLCRPIHLWTGTEIVKLRRLYPSASKAEIIAAFPFSTWAQIKSAARRYGFRRDRPPFIRSGNLLMDMILDRCEAIGWSYADLDDECGTGQYFQNRCWRKYPVNSRAALKAIAVLGGVVSVKWVEESI